VSLIQGERVGLAQHLECDRGAADAEGGGADGLVGLDVHHGDGAGAVAIVLVVVYLGGVLEGDVARVLVARKVPGGLHQRGVVVGRVARGWLRVVVLRLAGDHCRHRHRHHQD